MSMRGDERMLHLLREFGQSLGTSGPERECSALGRLLATAPEVLRWIRRVRPGEEWDLFQDAAMQALRADARGPCWGRAHARAVAWHIVRCTINSRLRRFYVEREAAAAMIADARGGTHEDW